MRMSCAVQAPPGEQGLDLASHPRCKSEAFRTERSVSCNIKDGHVICPMCAFFRPNVNQESRPDWRTAGLLLMERGHGTRVSVYSTPNSLTAHTYTCIFPFFQAVERCDSRGAGERRNFRSNRCTEQSLDRQGMPHALS